MIIARYLVFFILVLSVSCTPSYYKFIKTYPAKTDNGSEPDYSNLDNWAAHPFKKDPSDSISRAVHDAWRDSSVDVFFLHPTTFWDESRMDELNGNIYNDTLNAKTDYSSILYQASVFNADARIFAPRYRQAHLAMYTYPDTVKAHQAFELAYQDIRNAFTYYLEHFNKGRPIIIASHSQGTTHAKRLIKEFFDGKPLQNRLVVAYMPGIYVSRHQFDKIHPCNDSLQTGCYISWRTFRTNYEGPEYISREPHDATVINPLTWTPDTLLAPKSLHRGAVLYNFKKLYPHPNNARVKGNILWISRPKFFGGFLYRSKNYHAGDINLFYMNIRQDVRRRISLFWKR